MAILPLDVVSCSRSKALIVKSHITGPSHRSLCYNHPIQIVPIPSSPCVPSFGFPGCRALRPVQHELKLGLSEGKFLPCSFLLNVILAVKSSTSLSSNPCRMAPQVLAKNKSFRTARLTEYSIKFSWRPSQASDSLSWSTRDRVAAGANRVISSRQYRVYSTDSGHRKSCIAPSWDH